MEETDEMLGEVRVSWAWTRVPGPPGAPLILSCPTHLSLLICKKGAATPSLPATLVMVKVK